MNENKSNGIRKFKGLIVSSIRDGVLQIMNDPSLLASFSGIPESELGTIVDLEDHQRQALTTVISKQLDLSIESLLYALDDEPDGIQILYNEEELNNEGDYNLSDSSISLLENSRFDENGDPKQN